MAGQIYSTDLKLNRANFLDTFFVPKPAFEHELVHINDIFSSKIHDKRDDFNYKIVNFHSL